MNTEKNCHQVFVGKEKDLDAIEHITIHNEDVHS